MSIVVTALMKKPKEMVRIQPRISKRLQRRIKRRAFELEQTFEECVELLLIDGLQWNSREKDKGRN